MNQNNNHGDTRPNNPVMELDQLFIGMTRALCATINHTASDAAMKIIDLSSGFLSQQTQQLLVEFHKLYSDHPDLDGYKAEINRDVDNIIDSASQSTGANPGDEQSPGFRDDTSLGNTRTGLAAVQKDLENQISMDERVREHILPVLESMQFEEMLARSLAQTIGLWELVTSSTEQSSIDDINQKILSTLTSKNERELFYRIVLQQEFNEDHGQNHDI